jgi:acyl carrier protein
VKDELRRFIVNELNFQGAVTDLTDDFPLLEEAVVDSLGLLNIVTFLESSFGIEVADEDLVPDNFATIATIARFVEAKREGRTS